MFRCKKKLYIATITETTLIMYILIYSLSRLNSKFVRLPSYRLEPLFFVSTLLKVTSYKFYVGYVHFNCKSKFYYLGWLDFDRPYDLLPFKILIMYKHKTDYKAIKLYNAKLGAS